MRKLDFGFFDVSYFIKKVFLMFYVLIKLIKTSKKKFARRNIVSYFGSVQVSLKI